MITPEEKFILAGDWHGNWPEAERVIRHAHDQGIQIVVQVGDFGVWQGDKKYLNKINTLLKAFDMHMYFIDGNHENFDMLNVKGTNEDGTRFVRERVSHLPRGFRWEWNGVSFLALGGAASIDRKHRREGTSWWKEELITDEDVAKSIEGGVADVMITHDSPASAPNSITDDLAGQMGARMYYGDDVLDECTAHRQQLARVTDVVQPKVLFHGHYHKHMSGYYRHLDQDWMAFVVGLDEGKGLLSAHTYIFDFEAVKPILEKVDRPS